MSEVTREKLIALANSIEDYQDDMALIREDIKKAYDDFAKENDCSKKVLKAAVKAHLACKKDKAKFLDESNELDKLIDIILGEKATTPIGEDEL
jgi:uncharacterized protein (UPF0335 family)